jgi:CheY-like chemotaxis protein
MPDLILDLVMPGLTGLEVCRMIRKSSQIPIIVCPQKAPNATKWLRLNMVPMTTSPSLSA